MQKSSLESNLDRNLSTLLGKLSVSHKGDASGFGVEIAAVDFTVPKSDPALALFAPGSHYFFQLRDPGTGLVLARSESLLGRELPRRNLSSNDRTFWDEVLAGSGRVRLVGLPVQKSFSGTDQIRTMNLIVGNDRMFIDGRLRILVGTLVAASVFFTLFTLFIVNTVVARGLAPLVELGGQLDSIDAQNIDANCFATQVPCELQPVRTALTELVQRFDRSLERERRFSSDMAHEFRTPLAELRALAEVAIRWPHRASSRDYEAVLTISVRMQCAVEALYQLSRLEGEPTGESFVKIPLHTSVMQCWTPFAEKAMSKGITLQLEVDEQLFVYCDLALLELILKNLLENAVEYSPEESSIVVSARDSADRKVWLSVENLAPDLDPSDVDFMFRRFWRGDPARVSAEHSGLGLSLVSACAVAMRFSLISELDESGILKVRLGEIAMAENSPA